MRKRVSYRTKNKFKTRMRSFIKDISRPIKLYTPASRLECPNCYYDKLTDKSTNECKWTVLEAVDRQAVYEAAGGTGIMFRFFTKGRCPVCHARGYLETQKISYINCNVRWDPSVSEGSTNRIVAIPAGLEGSTMVTLKTDTKYADKFKSAETIEVDGVRCKPANPPIMRGIGDDVLLIVAAFTTEKLEAPPPTTQKIYTMNDPDDTVLALSDGTLLLLSDGALLELV